MLGTQACDLPLKKQVIDAGILHVCERRNELNLLILD
jgi:hypothetical protein